MENIIDPKTKKFHSGAFLRNGWIDYLCYTYGNNQGHKIHTVYQAVCTWATMRKIDGKICRVKIEQGESFTPGLRSIARDCRMSLHTVKTCLDRLHDGGALKIATKPMKGISIIITCPNPKPPRNCRGKRRLSKMKQSLLDDLLLLTASLWIKPDMLQLFIKEETGRKTKPENLSPANLEKLISRIKREMSPENIKEGVQRIDYTEDCLTNDCTEAVQRIDCTYKDNKAFHNGEVTNKEVENGKELDADKGNKKEVYCLFRV